MPPPLTPTDPSSPSRESPDREPQEQTARPTGFDSAGSADEVAEVRSPADGDAPVSFVPHTPEGAIPRRAVRIRTAQHGDLEEHELIRLLGDIEDERARGRFRESIYISLFVWLAIAWVLLYGPRYLWHAPKLILPSDVLHQRELTRLEAPALKASPSPRAAAPRPAPRVDNRTLERLREAAPKPTPPARTPAVQPRASTPDLSPSTRPNVPLPSAPQPVPARPAPPVVAEAPTPQLNNKPTFNTGGSAGTNIQSAIEGAARNRGAGGGAGTAHAGSGKASLGTGYEILSDTQGVNFDPYLRRILRQIYDQWMILLPEEVNPPLSKQGSTLVRFSILPDGNIGSMNLDGSTHDGALNKAAWGSITSVGQFPPLPPQFHGPKLELRINYLVNQKER